MHKGKLFLIPTYLSPSNDASFIAPMVIDVIKHCSYYFVENIRTARRFLSSLNSGLIIEQLTFFQLNKKSARYDLYPFFESLKNGEDIALMSEAGLPCLADPGNIVVAFSHQAGIQVVPLPGASSIQMTLIASGLNGQQFTFHGYLPIDHILRNQKIRELEKAAQAGYSQLFTETPYRNHQMFKAILETCCPDSLLSIASDISGENEFILTQSVQKWKTTDIRIHKIPTIFSFGQFP
ncbi:MAG: SAM-dependent methyltransferase [Ekhidna sp.]|nr:SAM-dependent methyltransferase [Ekhidna sp.]